MKIKHQLIFMLFVCTLCFTSCEKEEDFSGLDTVGHESLLRTVSPSEVQESFNSSRYAKRSSEEEWLKPYFEYNNEIQLINSAEKITVTPVVASIEKAYSRLFSIEIDGELQSVVYHMFANENSTLESFNGQAFVTNTAGDVIAVFEIEDNEYTKYYNVRDSGLDLSILDYANRNTSSSSKEDDWDLGELPEVVVIAPPPSGNTVWIIHWLFEVPQIEDEGDGGSGGLPNTPPTGGGSSDTNQDACPPGQIQDDNGNCIDPPEEEECPEGFEKNSNGKCVTDICDELNAQLENEDFIAELNCIANNQSASCEIGFAETLDGNFPELEPANNGHSVDFSSLDLSNVVGFLHTHTCNPQSQNPNSYSIQMPSPTDITKFIQLLGVTNSEGRSLQDAYLIMASCETGLYTLKYSGTFEDLRYFNASEDIYKRYFKKYKDNELKAFMKYLEEEVKIDGIEVIKYEMNNDDVSVETIQLNGSGEVVNLENCN